MGKRRTDPGYGQGEVTLGADDEALLDEQALTEQLLTTLQDPGYRPPTLPSVSVELMSLAQKPGVTFDDVVALLERDTMLTGRVMKLVQSPIYAAARRVTSLKQALVRIGLNALRDMVFEASLQLRVFRSDAYADTMERLRRHSAVVAHLSRLICRYTAIEGEYAFLCGLLHDVGIAGILLTLGDSSAGKLPPDLTAIWPALDRAHAPAGDRIAELWGLPQEIRMVIGAHHQVMIQGFPHPLAATVCLADDLAHALGVGLLPEKADEELSLERACLQSLVAIDASGESTLAAAREALALDERKLELIRSDAEEIAAAIE
ncbi:MAG: HDOD domain-containing protein [Myxococcota bacterium]